MSISPADCPDASVHGNPFRYCPSCSWIEPQTQLSRPATIGSIVHYKLSDNDALAINNKRIKDQTPGNTAWPGDVYPAMIVRTWGDTPQSSVQLQVFLDGPDTHWATSRTEGAAEGRWSWPE